MFDPALEYRKYVQRQRTIDEKQLKLTNLALKVKAKEPNLSFGEILNSIVESYQKGYDIPSPEFFEQEDIEDFARKNHLMKDPLVQSFIAQALPREAVVL